MFGPKKSKQALATPAQPNIFKKAERRFFHFFNNKTKMRRVALVGAMAWAPAFGIASMNEEKPDTQRSAEGAAHVQQYRSEISSIARESYTILQTAPMLNDITSEQQQALFALSARQENLAARLVMDTDISEQDAATLAKEFLRAMDDPAFFSVLTERMRQIHDNGAFIRDAREEAQNRSDFQAARTFEKTRQITAIANEKSSDDYWYSFFLTYIISFSALQGTANALLRRGARRDDKLKAEERQETVLSHTRDLRDLLTPRTPSSMAQPVLPASSPRRNAPKK